MKKLFFVLFLLLSKNFFAQNFDINTLKKINVERNNKLDGTMQFISNAEFVYSTVTPVSVLAYGFLKRDKNIIQEGITISASFVANAGSTYILKRIINRDRPATTYPFLQPLENEKKYSFPSGHTSSAFNTAMASSLAFKKWYVIVPSFMFASGVAYSRMHLGVHYPSDVLAGAILGVGSAWVSYQGNKWLRKKIAKK